MRAVDSVECLKVTHSGSHSFVALRPAYTGRRYIREEQRPISIRLYPIPELRHVEKVL